MNKLHCCYLSMLYVLSFIHLRLFIGDYIKQKKYVLTSRSNRLGTNEYFRVSARSGKYQGILDFIHKKCENVIKSGKNIFLLDQHYKKFK